jgi:hypothetical protein
MRIRQNLHNTLSRKFVAQVQEYQEMQTKYKNKYRDRVGRQLKVVKPDASQVAPILHSHSVNHSDFFNPAPCPSFWYFQFGLACLCLLLGLS